jgi:hypothetical protein
MCMETQEIIKALPKLSIDDRLTIAEIALSSIDIKGQVITERQLEQKLRMAANLAIADYSNDRELTIFTDLDGEDFLE